MPWVNPNLHARSSDAARDARPEGTVLAYGAGGLGAASGVRLRQRPALPAGSRGRRGARVSSVDEALARAEELLARLNERREELERLAEADDLDGDAAVNVIAELAELARQIEVELTRARTMADAAG